MADLERRQFGPYYTVRRLGGDRTGDLFAAYDPTPTREQHVALRVVRRRVARRAGFRKYFYQEMMQSARVQDSALIRVFDFGLQEEENLYYVAMELLNAHNTALSDLLAYLQNHNAVLRVSDAIHLVRQIAEAIEFVRINRCIPRSLAPTAIMIVPDNGREYEQGYQAVLTDPGLARFLDDDLESDLRDEVYQMGDLLYRLILGQNVSDPVVPPRVLFPELPPQVERVIYTALASKDETRHDVYDHTGLMAAALASTVAWTSRIENGPSFETASGKQSKLVVALEDWLLERVECDEPPASAPSPSAPSDSPAATTESAAPPLEVGLTGLGPDEKLSVAPGETKSVELSVTNKSPEIVHSRVQVDGISQSWWDAHPLTYDLGERGSATSEWKPKVSFHPDPGPQTAAKDHKIAIKVVGTDNGQARGQTATTLTVTAVHDLQIDAKPQTAAAGEPVKITIVNQGNVTENIHFSWWDKDSALDFEVLGKAVQQLTALVEPGGRETIEFRARPKRLHWFGKDRKYSYEIDAQNRAEPIPVGGDKKTEYKIQSRRLIPFWLVLLCLAVLLVLLLTILYMFRPQVINARSCDPTTVKAGFPPGGADAEARAGVCWDDTNYVRKFTLQPGNLVLNKNDAQKILVASEPLTQTVELIADNPLSFLPFYGYRSVISLAVITPTATATLPPPQPSLSTFCVVATGEQVQEACAPAGAITYFRGAVDSLELTWATQNLNGKQLILSPMAATVSDPEGQLSIPAPIDSVTYTLAIIGAEAPSTGVAATTVLTVPVIVNTIACRVDVEFLYLRQSPGQEFVTTGMLPDGTSIVLLSAPLDFQQNTDEFRWVKAVVADTNEEGWLAFDQDANDPTDDWIVCGQNDSLTGSGIPAGGGSTVNNQMLNNGPGQTSSGTPIPGQALPGGNNAPGGGGGAAAPIGPGSLPKTLPTFGPTVTPTPTWTPMPTSTLAPTATPEPTKPSLLISISDPDPPLIAFGGCVSLQWVVMGVKAVYFDFGRGDFDPIADNDQQYMVLCEGQGKDFGGEGEHNILFRWQIILENGQKVEKAKPLRVEEATPTPTP